jgi:quercetin dioxygenase-like cupin family protein
MEKIYQDKHINSQTFIRYFSRDVKEEELVWHRDKKTRKIKVVEGFNWHLQYDNSLPILLSPGDIYTIESEVWHRLLKGDSDLKLQINED